MAYAMLANFKAVLDRELELPSNERVLSILESVAQVFQVALPEEDGLVLYTVILCEIPTNLLKKAALCVCKTHKYKSLPLPADFLACISAELWQWRWLERTVNSHLVWLA